MSSSNPTSVVITAVLFPLTHTETNSIPSKKGGSIAPLSKKFAEITVPVTGLITTGVPLVFGVVVPIVS